MVRRRKELEEYGRCVQEYLFVGLCRGTFIFRHVSGVRFCFWRGLMGLFDGETFEAWERQRDD